MSNLSEQVIEPIQKNPQQDQRIEAAKTGALIAYVLMILGMFTGIFWFIGAVWAFVKKNDAQNTPYYDHYSNILRTFCWGIIWTIVGAALWVFFIGGFIIFATWIWSIYRIIKGLARLTSNKSYND